MAAPAALSVATMATQRTALHDIDGRRQRNWGKGTLTPLATRLVGVAHRFQAVEVGAAAVAAAGGAVPVPPLSAEGASVLVAMVPS